MRHLTQFVTANWKVILIKTMRESSKGYRASFAHGLMFHRFHKEGQIPSGQGSITSKQLEAILEYVGPKNILSPEEWLTKLKENKLARHHLCLTFDDGLRSQFDVGLAVLEKYGFKAFWFVFSAVFEGKIVKSEVYHFFAARYFCRIDDFYADFFSRCPQTVLAQLKEKEFLRYLRQKKEIFPFYSLNDLRYRFVRNDLLSQTKFEALLDGMIKEKGTSIGSLARNLWMSNAQLKKLSTLGHCIGLHSYTHPFALAQLSVRKQKDQYRKNQEHLYRICGQDTVSVSHPLNSYNDETLKILQGMGIVCGFRSNLTPPEGKKINPTNLELAREDATNILKALETFKR